MFGLRYLRLNRQLRKLLYAIRADARDVPLSATSQLSMTLDLQRQHIVRIEQQLAATQQTLKLAPIGYLQVDEENRLIFANPQVCHLLDLDLDDIPADCIETPRLFLEVVRSYELDRLIDQTRRQQVVCQQDWLIHRVSADPAVISRQPSCPVRGYGIPLLQGHVGVFLEDRQEPMQLMQQRDRWTSDVAHELKTPLTSIRLVAETLRVRVDPPLVGWLDRLLSEVIRLGNLVQDLLDLSHLEGSNPHALHHIPVNLPDLIQRAWLSLEPLSSKKQLQFLYDGPSTLRVMMDEHRFYRVLINLIDNAIKYSPPRGVLQIKLSLSAAPVVITKPTPRVPDPQAVSVGSTGSAGSAGSTGSTESTSEANSQPRFVILEVIDAGPGFAAEDLPRVFDRFYRADTARSRQAADSTSETDTTETASPAATSTSQTNGSSGLGLSIVRQIVEAHRGAVTAENHPETGGGWLTVQLPYQPPSG
jgi:two-component system phosphate regulon sensor histidine kinase PhoR